MVKLTKVEVKEKAAVVLKTLKGWWPDLTAGQFLAILSEAWKEQKKIKKGE